MANYYQFITDTGTIVPDTSTLLTDVQNEYKLAFGQNLNVSASTPQGLLITIETLARAGVIANNAQLANQINPNIAGGVFLDAILALMGSKRTPASYTLVTADLTGVPGTIIPSGSLAQNAATQELFALISQVTLDGTGNAVGNFQAVNSGEISADVNTLTIVYSAVLGWETINNPAAAATIGTDTQTDEQAKNFRIVTLAARSTSLAESMITNLFLTAAVNSLTFRENVSNVTQVIDGVTMVSHSLYACVDGGLDLDVANSMAAKKSGGCAYNNGAGIPVTVQVAVPFSGQVMNILFDRPTLIPILARATVKANTAIQDPVNTVKDAIMAYVNGQLAGEPGLTVGMPVSPFELAGAVNIAAPTIFVQNMEISLFSPVSYTNNTLSIQIFEKAFITRSSISVILL